MNIELYKKINALEKQAGQAHSFAFVNGPSFESGSFEAQKSFIAERDRIDANIKALKMEFFADPETPWYMKPKEYAS